MPVQYPEQGGERECGAISGIRGSRLIVVQQPATNRQQLPECVRVKEKANIGPCFGRAATSDRKVMNVLNQGRWFDRCHFRSGADHSLRSYIDSVCVQMKGPCGKEGGSLATKRIANDGPLRSEPDQQVMNHCQREGACSRHDALQLGCIIKVIVRLGHGVSGALRLTCKRLPNRALSYIADMTASIPVLF
jgi:hypothetical protein